MVNWIRKIFSNKPNTLRRVKHTIVCSGLEVRLYDVNFETKDNARNIEAFDLCNNLVWIVEMCPHGRYWEMQLDEANNQIEANNGSAMFYDIDIKTGRIVYQQMRK